jgi:hypothetical protein
MSKRADQIDATHNAALVNRRVRKLFGTERPMVAIMDDFGDHLTIWRYADACAALENERRNPAILDQVICAELDR